MNVELDGWRVVAWRAWEGATQEEAAKRMGIAPDTLSRVERNLGPVTLNTARKIAALMDVEPRSLGRRHLRAL